MFLLNEEPIRSKCSTLLSISAVHQTFLYFDLYLNTAYAAHYVYFSIKVSLRAVTHCHGFTESQFLNGLWDNFERPRIISERFCFQQLMQVNLATFYS